MAYRPGYVDPNFCTLSLLSALLFSSLELSDTTIYEPYIRALFGTASHFCEAVDPKLGAVLLGTLLKLGVLRVIRCGAQAMYKRGAALSVSKRIST